MPESLSATSRLIINETIDGLPAAEATAAAPEQRKAEAKAAPAEKKHRRYDPYIWGIYLFLLMISVVELFSASSAEVSGSNVFSPLIRHGRFLLVGFLLVLWLQNVHYKWFKKYAPALALLSLGLLVFASYFGLNINGAQRAISLGPLGTLQPAELVKLTCMLYLAKVLAKHQMSGGVTARGVVIAAVAVVVFSAFTINNGLTNTLLLMGISMIMFIIGGIQWRKIGIVLLIYGVCGGVFMMIKHQNSEADEFDQVQIAQTEQVSRNQSVNRFGTWGGRVKRFLAGVNPDDPVNDENRQVILSKFAMANGGLTGKGPGNSRESARLPLAFSDYIYSIIIEDTGMLGGIGLLVLYLCLLGRAGRVASRCYRAFPALLIMGCAVLIVFQSLIHMAIVTGLFPVSGQPLPLISKGGTSIIVMSAAIGMMLSVSRYAVRGNANKKEIKAEQHDLPEDMQAINPTMIESSKA